MRNNRTEMTASFVCVFILNYLSFIFRPAYGFEVIQPRNRMVNSDRSASISCEHTANGASVKDVQLIGMPLTGNSGRTLLCQKGMNRCENIIMHQENPKKFLFIILNVDLEAKNMKYECEFTVQINDLDYTETGTPTLLLLGQTDTVCGHSPAPPPPPQSLDITWIMIGLLALMFLYCCAITYFYVTLKLRSRTPEDSTYVVMRKAPLSRNSSVDIYCG
ncbi:uncharacterized protein [Antennarius striatus]|uniref:uncharacterized protein isoform X2 n=1 Tax=Antennarius striatus TaxID=241820 RepID=UPI0035B4DFF1